MVGFCFFGYLLELPDYPGATNELTVYLYLKTMKGLL